jgi:predicted Zn-dependent protease
LEWGWRKVGLAPFEKIIDILSRHYMIESMRRLSAIALLLLLVFSCAVNPVTGEKELVLMSEAQEMEMGEGMYPLVLWGELGGGGKYVDANLEAYLRGIVKSIHRVSHRPGLSLTFEVQNSSIPNAWAIPGHVSMTRGLLAHLENEAQFAFIMGHEMGHVAARHSVRQYTRQVLQSAALVGGSLFLKESQAWMFQTAAIGSTLFFLKYSREDELEADRLGVEYMARAGYRPEEAVNAHRRLEAAVADYRSRAGLDTPEENVITRLLSTHPRTELRFEEVRSVAGEVGRAPQRGDGMMTRTFRSQTASLRKTHEAYHRYDKALAMYREKKFSEAAREVDAALAMSPDQAPFHNLRGRLRLQKKAFAAARQSFDKALALYSDYHLAWQSIGLLEYEREKYEAAVPPLEKSLEIFPQSAGSHYLLGMSYQRLGRHAEAIPHLEAYKQAAPRDPMIHGTLGMAYERVGELPRAYNEYSIQVQVAPDSELGRYAAERVRVLGPRLKGK